MGQDAAQHARHALVGTAVTALAALVYANALANGFVWDDPISIERWLPALQSPRALFFPPPNIPQFPSDYYRPLQMLSYLIDRKLGGGSPFPFHLSVVLFHVVATYLVFRFGLVLFRPSPAARAAAGWGAALFAVHPIHTESVAWMAARPDVMVSCAALAAGLVYRHTAWRAWWRAILAATLVFVGLLAKENAAAMLLLIPLSDRVFAPRPTPAGHAAGAAPRDQPRERPLAAPMTPVHALPFVAALLAYLGLRETALWNTVGSASPLGIEALPKLVAAVGMYLRMLVLPIRQSAYISELPTNPIALTATAVVVAATAAAGWVAWRRHERPVTFLLLWIGVTLAPSLAVVVKLTTAPVAERYLYLPSVGFCLLCGYGAARVLGCIGTRNGRAGVTVILIMVLAGAAMASWQRNTVWRSNLSLWQDTAAKNTTHGLPMRSLATAYQQLGDTTKAAESFALALQRHNDVAGQFLIYNNLGTLAMHDKKLDQAERYYRTALTFRPLAPDCLFNLALIALTRATDASDPHDAGWKHAQAQQARQLFERAAQLSPFDADVAVALGQTLSALGDRAGARAQYERALHLGLPPSTAASVRKLLADLR